MFVIDVASVRMYVCVWERECTYYLLLPVNRLNSTYIRIIQYDFFMCEKEERDAVQINVVLTLVGDWLQFVSECVCLCVCVCLSVCVCMCVCVFEREETGALYLYWTCVTLMHMLSAYVYLLLLVCANVCVRERENRDECMLYVRMTCMST